MLDRFGLYYPYVRIRDEEWVKTAALYMPALARVVPGGYHVDDSPTVRALRDELGFVRTVDPAQAAQRLTPVFRDVLQRYGPDLRRWYEMAEDVPGPLAPYVARAGVQPGRPWSVRAEPPWQRSGGTRPLADLHRGEIAGDVRDMLLDTGLALPRFSSWITMDAALAWVYKCALVEEVARVNGFTPATDQPAAHIASGSWDADGIASALLDDTVSVPAHDDVRAVGLLALRIVTPDHLADVPVQKIIRLRGTNAALFGEFSAAVARVVNELTEAFAAQGITGPLGRELRIAERVEREFTGPLDELRGAMKGLRIDTAFSAANLKFELPAAVGAAALGLFGNQPLLDAGAGAAFALGALGRSAAGQRRALVKESPVAAYLLCVERGLAPSSLLDRLIHRR
ncbi:DUF6236 family protein [Actinacidiphila acididurans]|uniref:Uncharacterized protein n=1 Tax=Actinacidiphila acididurans TaxID=2784346 RepID=A0ABS2TW90_9ACTN|nr:DUF6236 family protein [Actinacidiphila acididurans]MBM9506555.1 hypothetical protein [Actinacidiphila acididurans]